MEQITQQKLTALWRTYNHTKALDDVLRQGYIVCGTGKIQPKSKSLRNLRRAILELLHQLDAKLGNFRPETDGGHTFGTIILADLIGRYFPEHLPSRICNLVKEGLIYHEADELFYGDSLDDGTQNTANKASQANESLDKILGQTPNVELLIEILTRAERMKGCPYRTIDPQNLVDTAAWWIKAIDKTEAILQNGRYHQQGIVGHISQKDNPSDRDLRSTHTVGTDDITLVWAEAATSFLKDTILWQLILAMINDTYEPSQIPHQFKAL